MEILWEHPDVFVPPNKGTRFFNTHFDKGIRWYEGFFRGHHGRRIAGEVCEDYLGDPEALGRVREYRPDMRLICCLRNPYERAISSWQFFARNGLGRRTLTAQAERSPEVFLNGYYHTQLKVVQSLFPKEQLLVLLYDELVTDPQSTARRVYQHIGAAADFVPPSLYRRVNAAGRPRIALLARLVHDIHMHSWGSSRTASNLIGRIKRVTLVRRAVRALLYDERREAREIGGSRNFVAEFPSRVAARYEEEIGALELLLGRDLTSWRVPRNGLQRASCAPPDPPAIPAVCDNRTAGASLTEAMAGTELAGESAHLDHLARQQYGHTHTEARRSDPGGF